MEAVGLAFSVAQTLFAALQCKELKDFLSAWGYKAELESLERTVKTIKALLYDVDEKQARGYELKKTELDFIKKLKDALYDADDLLDEFATLAAQQEQLQNSKKVRRWLSRLKRFFGATNRMSQEIKNIRKKLDGIASDADKYSFKVDYQPIKTRREETCSYLNEKDIIGREDDKRKIIDKLLNSNVQRNIDVLTIVGMGGLGKTALAQLVFNDPEIKTEFPNHKFWVCVSDEGGRSFSDREILANILKSANVRINNNLELEHIVQKLREVLDKNKFLLVLDDIWTEDRNEWLRLEEILLGLAPRGSKVIVTTRSEGTAIAVASGYTHKLQGLSDENSWRLFKMAVGWEWEGEPNHELVKMGEEIVKKCGNVPLAIKVIGSLLYGQDISTWRFFHQSGLAKIKRDDGQNNDNKIVQILKFSYYQLSLPLKNCFIYCALFPKDFKISKEKLISLWMAQGYVNDEGKNPEDVAENYFKILVLRCFFQNVKKDDLSGRVSFQIHDLMHDIAQQVAGNEICVANSATSTLDENIRHVFDQVADSRTQGFVTGTKIRSYIQDRDRHGYERECFSQFPMSTILVNWRSLRALDLSNLNMKSLPDAIGSLLHLRYLDLFGNSELRILPKSFTQLINLQTLNLGFCESLEELPKDFNKLVKLRALEVPVDYRNWSVLSYMPLGMEKLTSLSWLNYFRVADRESSVEGDAGGLQDLRGLTNLRGSLKIWISHEYQHVVENGNRGGYLSHLKHLTDISIWFFGKADIDIENDPGTVRFNEALLEDLQPHQNLEKLEVVYYPGVTIPRWAKQDNFAKNLPNLVRIEFQDCGGLRSLPWLGNLPSLKSLEVSELMNLEYMEDRRSNSDNIGGYGAETEQESSFFPSLEYLDLKYLPKLTGWWTGSSTSMSGSELGMGDDESLNSDSRLQTACSHRLPSFPRLSKLFVQYCPNLTVIPLCPTVEVLELYDFNEKLQIMTKKEQVPIEMDGSDDSGDWGHEPKLRSIDTTNVRNLKSLPSGALQRLDTMIILCDEEVESLSEVEDVFRSCSSSLKSLVVSDCLKLRSLSGGLEYLTVLNSLSLHDLPSLRFEEVGVEDSMPWRCLHQCLRSLELRRLPQLVDLPKGMQCLTALQDLTIERCPNLEEIPEWIGYLSSLESIRIWKNKVETLPQSMEKLSSLRTLEMKRSLSQYS